ncbi:hypothetical protein [Bradyrhizobium iriomotense]|uniref:hypothetical protein n=1 Tax=Bradyrhizobium iriomotense TaxID=441950 RepID=UPI001B8A0FF3|nr:hypothetical protein [Bradyrhizobium iriomotense]MBR0786693.1 hypothetical protein [Bradyrhizobium iriomotense]
MTIVLPGPQPAATCVMSLPRDFKRLEELYILYEDEFQVAAFPFSDTPTQLLSHSSQAWRHLLTQRVPPESHQAKIDSSGPSPKGVAGIADGGGGDK